MKKNQKTALWIGIIVIALIGLFPPWVQMHEVEGPYKGKYDKGYSPIFAPPKSPAEIDISRLLIQWFIVAVIAAGAIVTLKDKKGPIIPRKT